MHTTAALQIWCKYYHPSIILFSMLLRYPFHVNHPKVLQLIIYYILPKKLSILLCIIWVIHSILWDESCICTVYVKLFTLCSAYERVFDILVQFLHVYTDRYVMLGNFRPPPPCSQKPKISTAGIFLRVNGFWLLL